MHENRARRVVPTRGVSIDADTGQVHIGILLRHLPHRGDMIRDSAVAEVAVREEMKLP